MKLYEKIKQAQPLKRVIVLGNFDGVHLGHKELLKLARRIADEKHLPLMAFTFYPQGQEMFNKDFLYLTTQEKKFEIFAEMGVDEILSIPFDAQIARITPEDFALKILAEELEAAEVVVGYNYTFGYKGAGGAADLKEMLSKRQITVSIVPQHMVEGQTVSSSLIRRLLLEGNIELADKMLGYPYALKGEVVKGRQVGRTIGIPTANIAVWPQVILPRKGVYAARVHHGQRQFLGVLNIGQRPTVHNGNDTTVEVHLLDFDEDIYGEILEVELYAYLRGESKFAGLANLKAQIENDMAAVRKILG